MRRTAAAISCRQNWWHWRSFGSLLGSLLVGHYFGQFLVNFGGAHVADHAIRHEDGSFVVIKFGRIDEELAGGCRVSVGDVKETVSGPAGDFPQAWVDCRVIWRRKIAVVGGGVVP